MDRNEASRRHWLTRVTVLSLVVSSACSGEVDLTEHQHGGPTQPGDVAPSHPDPAHADPSHADPAHPPSNAHTTPSFQNGVFLETFDNSPDGPMSFTPPDWDIDYITPVDGPYVLAPMEADHGMDCMGTGTHVTSGEYPDMVFSCRDHLMTSTNVSTNLWLIPPVMVDFSDGEATISWDVSSLRRSSRDWWEILIVPFDQDMMIAGVNDLFPKDAIRVKLLPTGTVIMEASVNYGGQPHMLSTLAEASAEGFVYSQTRRDKYELKIKRDHFKLRMVDFPGRWIDEAIPPLDWSEGLVYIGHFAYNPTKGGEVPNTWHWDNINIKPAKRVTLLRGDRRIADKDHPEIRFPAPAPDNAFLRGWSRTSVDWIEYSLDGGATWRRELPDANVNVMASSYAIPIPAGTQSVRFRGGGDNWHLADMSIFAR